MEQAKGIEAGFAVFEENVYGQDPTSPNGQKLYLKTFEITKTQDKEDDETLSAGRGVLEPIDGSVDVGGSLTANLSGQSLGVMIKHLLGSVATTGSGPYSHVFTIGDLPIGLTLELDNGPSLAGPNRYVKYNGCRVASASFTFADKGFIECSFTMMGADGVKSSTPLDATLTDYGHKAFAAFSAVLLEGGSAFASAKTITLNIDNDLEGDSYVVGGQGKRQSLAEGRCKVTGQLTVLLNTAGQALVNKGLDGTETSLKITVKEGNGLGTEDNASCEFLVQQLKYSKVVPGVTGPSGREASLDFSAYLNAADLGLQITLKNAVDSI